MSVQALYAIHGKPNGVPRTSGRPQAPQNAKTHLFNLQQVTPGSACALEVTPGSRS